MDKLAIEHRGDSKYSFAISDRELKIRLRIKKGDDIISVKCLWNVLEKMYISQMTLEMKIAYEDEYYSFYEATLYSEDPRFAYIFLLETKDGKKYYYSELGLSETYDFAHFYISSFRMPYINPIDVEFDNPRFKGDLFYQIFVDRFFSSGKGDKSYINRPRDSLDLRGHRDNRKQDVFLGGDLKGVSEKLDYLKDLGVDSVYLTPICRGSSNHKYDVIDYFKIDPMFGDDSDLKEFVDKAHSLGMKVVLDLVFNHSSFYNEMFQDVVKNGKNSKYYNFYIVHGDKPDKEKRNYDTFGSVAMMPKLNSNDYLENDYFVCVGKYFIEKFSIDGFRLDVANEVSHTFWERFKYELRRIKKDVILIGECRNDASSYLGADQMDSVMNYQFMLSCIDFYVDKRIDVEHFVYRLIDLYLRYPEGNSRMMLNLLDSHDTERFYNMVKPDIDIYLMAVLNLIAYPGWAMIYYGDEIFMEGGTDPDNRRGMEWDSKFFHSEKYELLKSILHLRKLDEFRSGAFSISSVGPLLKIVRSSLNSDYSIYINNSETKWAIDEVGAVVVANNFDKSVVKPYGFVVLKTK
jgi:cyclomaltodextrinase